MHKNSFKISYNQLQSDIDLKGNEIVFVENNGKVKEYKVIYTEEELLEYTLNVLDYFEKDLGLIVTFECSNWVGSFNNAIFLKNFNIDYCSKPQEIEYLFLNFQNCEFFGCVTLMGGDYEDIVINNSIFRKELLIGFANCKNYFCTNNLLQNNAAIKNSTFNNFFLNSTRIKCNLYFEEDSVLEDFKFEKSKLLGSLDFIDCTFEESAKFSKLAIEQNASFNLSYCSFYKISEINFDSISGKISIYKTNFSDKCYFEYELLEKQNFSPIIIENNLKTTKWSFFHISNIYKSNGKTDQYLDTYYYFKKYERLERKNADKWKPYLLDYFVEKTTMYYTSWKRTLWSMFWTLLIFFIIYCFFPNFLVYKDVSINSENIFITTIKMLKNSNFDWDFLLRKFGNILYFTIITFSTVGYGDITPLYFIKIICGIEGLLGIFFTSSFVVSLSRKFLG